VGLGAGWLAGWAEAVLVCLETYLVTPSTDCPDFTVIVSIRDKFRYPKYILYMVGYVEGGGDNEVADFAG